MEPISIKELLQAVGGSLLGSCTELDKAINHVFIDSRKPQPGALFVPLVGERFDGHKFIQSALEGGASGCLTAIELDEYAEGKFYVKVEDTQKALGDLAHFYKNKFNIPIIGVTGSVGKTTTKDMLAAVLGEKFSVLKTDGNFNNGVGLPLTIFRLNSSHEICVLEMGMSEFGEIENLSKIAEPDVAVISNVGDAHIENLGSRAGILQAKCEIFSHMKKESGLVVLNGDDAMLSTLVNLGVNTVFCGGEAGLTYQATNVTTDGESKVTCCVTAPDGQWDIEIPALGNFMIYPTLMAVAVGQHFGMTQEEITTGILGYVPTKMRMNILKRSSGITILDDAYNANPQSMRAGLDVLVQVGKGTKIAILGDMFELGEMGRSMHSEIGEYLANIGVDKFLAIGTLAEHMARSAENSGVKSVQWVAEKESAKEILAQWLEPNCTVLVKASRGMGLEDIVTCLQALTEE